VLVELGLLEQRHKAVLEVLNGATVTDVARRYGGGPTDPARLAATLRPQRHGRPIGPAPSQPPARTPMVLPEGVDRLYAGFPMIRRHFV